METTEYKGYEIKIEQDDVMESPRDWDNITTFALSHKRYDLPNEAGISCEDFDSWEEVEKWIKKEFKPVAIKPVYMYDHSGVTIKTSPFNCGWDSGQVGFVFITKEQAKELGKDFPPERAIEADVKTYAQYLEGDVWGYSISSPQHEDLESLWGLYGYEYALQEAKEYVDWDMKQYKSPARFAKHAKELHR